MQRNDALIKMGCNEAGTVPQKGKGAAMDIQIGDTLVLKKGHPCGGQEWTVLRVGADIRIKCGQCGHLVLLPRAKLEKQIKKNNDQPVRALPAERRE